MGIATAKMNVATDDAYEADVLKAVRAKTSLYGAVSFVLFWGTIIGTAFGIEALVRW